MESTAYLPTSCPECGTSDTTETDTNTRRCGLCTTQWGTLNPDTEDASNPEPSVSGVPTLVPPTASGWFAISGVELARALRRVADGESPESVYFSILEVSEVPAR